MYYSNQVGLILGIRESIFRGKSSAHLLVISSAQRGSLTMAGLVVCPGSLFFSFFLNCVRTQTRLPETTSSSSSLFEPITWQDFFIFLSDGGDRVLGGTRKEGDPIQFRLSLWRGPRNRRPHQQQQQPSVFVSPSLSISLVLRAPQLKGETLIGWGSI